MTIIYFKKEKTFNDIENTNIIHCESEKTAKLIQFTIFSTRKFQWRRTVYDNKTPPAVECVNCYTILWKLKGSKMPAI